MSLAYRPSLITDQALREHYEALLVAGMRGGVPRSDIFCSLAQGPRPARRPRRDRRGWTRRADQLERPNAGARPKRPCALAAPFPLAQQWPSRSRCLTTSTTSAPRSSAHFSSCRATSWPWSAARMRNRRQRSITSAGRLRSAKLKYIFITHQHFDHFAGVEAHQTGRRQRASEHRDRLGWHRNAAGTPGGSRTGVRARSAIGGAHIQGGQRHAEDLHHAGPYAGVVADRHARSTSGRPTAR